MLYINWIISHFTQKNNKIKKNWAIFFNKNFNGSFAFEQNFNGSEKKNAS